LTNDVADQGVTSIVEPAGHVRVVTRGSGTVPADLRRQGWVHVGDPDSHAGYLLDAYQGRPNADAKLFVLTAPDGSRSGYVHHLLRGEMFNNSFIAIAPGGQWFVAGEWGTIRRLLVFAMPGFNLAAPRPGRNLVLAAMITLTRPMRRVQGCSFASPTSLVCSTDDRRADLYGVAQQILTVQLARPLDGRAVTGAPSLLGAVPHLSACPGLGETEGIDIHGRHLRLAQVEPTPCRSSTLLYSYSSADSLPGTQHDTPDGVTAPPLGHLALPTQDGVLNRRAAEHSHHDPV